jgi:hypothetical protein
MRNRKLLYNGPLSEDVTGWILSAMDDYGFVIEIDKTKLHHPDFLTWHKNNPEYPSTKENCMGQKYTVMEQHYCWISRDFSADGNVVFLFFKSSDEKEGFLTNFPNCVISAEPFQTVIG